MNTEITIGPEEIVEIYSVLDGIGCLGSDRSAGYLRAAYSAEETEAMRYIEELALACGAQSRWDAVGCLFLEWPGSTPEFVECGSHLDTVPCGGNFDGAAGIVAGLTAIRAITTQHKQAGTKLKRGLRLRIWRSEEFACFGVLYAGSRAAFGQLDPKFLEFSFQGSNLETAMRSQGADPGVVRMQQATISTDEIDNIAAHIELHIEQGNLLENRNLDLGIVTSIRSSRRYRILLTGEFDHSGATPMGKEFRRDVNLALAHTLVELDKLYDTFAAAGEDIVQTFCVINSNKDFNENNPTIYHNATSVISGFGYFELEFRSNRLATLEKYTVEFQSVVSRIAQEFGVSVEIVLNGAGAPLETMDEGIQAALEQAAQSSGVSSVRMPCGAGHDAVIVGSQKTTRGTAIPVGMLLIPCLKGKSHNPAEYASPEAIAKGATVLARGMEALARG